MAAMGRRTGPWCSGAHLSAAVVNTCNAARESGAEALRPRARTVPRQSEQPGTSGASATGAVSRSGGRKQRTCFSWSRWSPPVRCRRLLRGPISWPSRKAAAPSPAARLNPRRVRRRQAGTCATQRKSPSFSVAGKSRARQRCVGRVRARGGDLGCSPLKLLFRPHVCRARHHRAI